jgi:hypothetical protein
MSKIPLDYDFGDPVIVMLRTTVQGQFTTEDGVIEVITDSGRYSSEDHNLIAVFPDVEGY